VDGVFLPEGPLNSTADVAYVLNQETGKLRIKNIKVWRINNREPSRALRSVRRGRALKESSEAYSHIVLKRSPTNFQQAITGKKAELEEQQQQLSAIMAEGMGQGVHMLERPEVPMGIKVRNGCEIVAKRIGVKTFG